MAKRSRYNLFTIIWSVIVTGFLLLAIGSKLIAGIIENSAEFLSELQNSLSNRLDPTLFFLLYMLGFILAWWKPIWGSLLIIFTCIGYLLVAGWDGPPIFAVPALIVGILHLIDWKRQNEIIN